jgi:hypothetical protein
MAANLSLQEILQALGGLSDQEQIVIQQHLDHMTATPAQSLSTLLATWDDSLSLQDAEELNQLIQESRHSKVIPPQVE